MSPIPSQLVNERATEARVGPQTMARSSRTGRPSSTPSTTRSRRVYRRVPRRPVRRPEVNGTVRTPGSFRGEDGLLLPFDVVDQAVHVVGAADEPLDRGDHDR